MNIHEDDQQLVIVHAFDKNYFFEAMLNSLYILMQDHLNTMNFSCTVVTLWIFPLSGVILFKFIEWLLAHL